MRRISRFGLTVMTVLALAAVTAASASAAKLDLTWNGEENQLALNGTFDAVVANIQPLEGYPYGYTEPGTATIEGNPGWGTVTCAASGYNTGWEGVDKTNNQATDKIELVNGKGLFAGEGECSNTSGLGAKATINFNPDASTLNLGAAGAASVVARYSSEPITLAVTYSGGDVCHYSATKLVGTVKLTLWYSWDGQLVTTLAKQPMTLVKSGSAPECSKKVYVSTVLGYAVDPTPTESPFGYGYFVFGHLAS